LAEDPRAIGELLQSLNQSTGLAQLRRGRLGANSDNLDYNELAGDLRSRMMCKEFCMLATLIFPWAEGVSQTYPLRLEFSGGHPVLLSPHGHAIKGAYFQLLRDRMGARIETDDVPVVAGILGLPANEPGLSATF
jgi:hypothetical protein